MINIIEKKDCCGCSACVQRCPRQCISLEADEEGFLYPIINEASCIDCGLCEKVCPVLHSGDAHKPLKVFAAKNNNEKIRVESSSGGVFTVLAELVIEEGGVVFGAKFDEHWDVIHDYTETKEGLAAFRGSKYVQSRIGDCFNKAKSFLVQGRKVLFSGTPCQISGLKRFLGKEYGNLLTVDFICHGVPSPKVWRMYLNETIARECEKNSVLPFPIHERNALVEGIAFRDKCLGWKKYSFALTLSTTGGSGVKNTVLLSELFLKNPFMRGFLQNLYLRPSCYHCPSKKLKSGSDLTIADFWGMANVLPELDDDKGYSVVILNKPGEIIGKCLDNIDTREIRYEDVLRHNSSIEVSVKTPQYRKLFFKYLNNGECIPSIHRVLSKERQLYLLRHAIKKVIVVCPFLNTIVKKYR